MKRLILLLCLFFISGQLSFSQWRFNEGGNNFDGNFKSASVQGVGSRFPYDDPILHINRFESGSENLYLKETGYYFDDEDVYIRFYFDDTETVYKVDEYSVGREGKTLFMNEISTVSDDVFIDKVDLIELLKKHSVMRIRVTSRNSRNDIIIPLQGSTNALNKLYPNIKQQKDRFVEMVEKIRVEELNASSLRIVQKELQKQLNLSWYEPERKGKVTGVFIRPKLNNNSFYGDVDVYISYENDDNLKVQGKFKVADDAPIYGRIDEEMVQLQSEEDMRFEKLGVQKFKIRRLIQTVVDKIEKEDSFTKQWNTDDIIEVRGLVTGLFRGKYDRLQLWIEIEGVGTQLHTLYIGKLKVTEEEFKEAGLQPDIEF